MSRSDLLVQLVESIGKDDKTLFKRVVEAIIAEEKAKQHNILAEKLQEALKISYNPPSYRTVKNTNLSSIDNLFYELKPEIRLDDLILDDSLKNVAKDIIEEHFRVDLLRSYGMEPRNRILLTGPPGNGKTSLAEAIAGELMIPLFSVRYDGLIASYLGETASRLRMLFEAVRTQHCVLFFDEFDSIGKERGDVHDSGEIKRLVSSLLLHIDKLPSYVVIIAATNHPELLDKAVWRRFQIKANLERPSEKQINEFVVRYQKSMDINFGFSNTSLSKLLKGLSFSEIKDICEDILRKYILTLPNSSNQIKKITNIILANRKLIPKPS